MFFTDPDVNGE